MEKGDVGVGMWLAAVLLAASLFLILYTVACVARVLYDAALYGMWYAIRWAACMAAWDAAKTGALGVSLATFMQLDVAVRVACWCAVCCGASLGSLYALRRQSKPATHMRHAIVQTLLAQVLFIAAFFLCMTVYESHEAALRQGWQQWEAAVQHVVAGGFLWSRAKVPLLMPPPASSPTAHSVVET